MYFRPTSPAIMPYSIEEGHEACDDGEVAVVKDSDGEVMGCHGTESDAQDQIAALEASEDERDEGLPLRAFADFAGDGWAERLPEAGIETRVDVQEMLSGVSRGFWRQFDDMAEGEDYVVPEVHLLSAGETEASGWLVAKNRATERYYRAGWTYMDEGPGPADVEYDEKSDWTEVQEEWVPVDGDAEEMEREAAERKAESRQTRGESLASRLESEVESMSGEDTPRSAVIEQMADAAGIEPSTVNSILAADIDCPPLDRLEGFAEVLDVEESTLVNAARQDGCEYDRSPAVHAGLEERGPQLGQYQRRTYDADVRRSSDGESTTVIINTDAVDGHGTIVDPSGMRLQHGNRRFSRNFFINHDMNLLAGESPEPQYRGDALQVQVSDDAWDHEDELVERWYRKVKKGLLTQASIGFMPIDGEYTERNGERVYRYTDWMLREWSFVPIASNPEADVTSRTPASRLEQTIERVLTRKLEEVATSAPDSSDDAPASAGPSSADKDPEGSRDGSEATDDGAESGTRVLTVQDAKRLLRKQKQKRRERAEEIAKRKLGMA